MQIGETIVIMDQNLNVQVLLGGLNSVGGTLLGKEVITINGGETSSVAGGDMGGDMNVDMNGNITGAATKDPILSNWPFVIGISSGTLVLSIVLGILLAKRKIKKGFELYED